jgi:hypothetical protein
MLLKFDLTEEFFSCSSNNPLSLIALRPLDEAFYKIKSFFVRILYQSGPSWLS